MILTTFEHATLTAQDFSQPSDFDWLIEQNFSCFSIERKAKRWQLKVRHYLGVIGLPSGQQLEILPKISQNADIKSTRHWIQTMLAEIWQELPNTPLPNIANQQILPQLNANLPLTTWLYQHFLQLLHPYQPNQHYQNTQQNQNYLQGKLLIKEQIQHNSHQVHRFFSQYDQFATTTASNRIIKTVLQLFATPLTMPQTWQNFWQTIEPLHPSQYAHFFIQSQQELLHFSHQQRQVSEPLLIFCQWLLQLPQPLPSFDNRHSGLTFLINMNTAFEKWVSFRLVKQFSPSDFQLSLQQSKALAIAKTGETLLSIKPDILLQREQLTIVADIKWKKIGNIHDISLTDLYQLITYTQLHQAQQAWLIYPCDHAKKAERVLLTVEKSVIFWLVAFSLADKKIINPII